MVGYFMLYRFGNWISGRPKGLWGKSSSRNVILKERFVHHTQYYELV